MVEDVSISDSFFGKIELAKLTKLLLINPTLQKLRLKIYFSGLKLAVRRKKFPEPPKILEKMLPTREAES